MTIDDPEVQQRMYEESRAAPVLDADALQQADVGIMAAAPRRRGRPPGSKNQSTIDRESQMVTRLNIPRGGRTDAATGPPPPSEADLARMRQAKKNKADAYTVMISEHLNDHLMTFLVSMGIPTEQVYAPGHAPSQEQHYKKYGPIGNALAIPPTTAKSLGLFLADLASTDTGSKVANLTDNPSAGLVLHGGVALLATFQWFQAFNATMKILQPQIALLKQQQAQEGQKQSQNGAGNGAS